MSGKRVPFHRDRYLPFDESELRVLATDPGMKSRPFFRQSTLVPGSKQGIIVPLLGGLSKRSAGAQWPFLVGYCFVWRRHGICQAMIGE